jgi:hypothetical protein
MEGDETATSEHHFSEKALGVLCGFSHSSSPPQLPEPHNRVKVQK